jgi:Tol biopolymer transport system component
MAPNSPLELAPPDAQIPAGVIISGVAPNSALTLISTDSAGINGNGFSYAPVISADGTKVLFSSQSTNLVAGDTNFVADIFLKDLTTGQTTLISQDPFAPYGLGAAVSASFSPDGTKILFVSGAFSGDMDIWIKDLATGADTLVSTSATGEANNSTSYGATFSPDGNKIAFFSSASNLVENDTNGREDLFIKDLTTGFVTRIALDVVNPDISGGFNKVTFSPDGTKLLLATDVDSLVAGDTNGAADIFVKDLVTGAVTLVSNNTAGTVGNSVNLDPVFSPDGNSVAFVSLASDLVAGDSNPGFDIFIKDLTTGITSLVSADPTGQQYPYYNQGFAFSPDGKTCVFSAVAGLITGSINGQGISIYIKDLTTGALTLVPGGFADGYINGGNFSPSYSADGNSIVFSSHAEYIDDNGVISENFGVFVYNIAEAVKLGEVIQGGIGLDTATYETSNAAVLVDLRNVDGTANTGDALRDTYVSIEKFRLSAHNDSFFGANTHGAKNTAFGLDGSDAFTSGGNSTTNTFDGGDGEDTFYGSAGKTVADGGNGNDVFLGGAGAESFKGGTGSDILAGGSGNDMLSGGTEADTFVFNLHNKGKDTVMDFELGSDKLQFAGVTLDDISFHVSGGDIKIEIANSAQSIIIQDITDIAALQYDLLFV